MNQQKASAAAAAFALGFAGLATAAEVDYPSKPVKIVVGFPPGQGVDTVVRVFAPRLQTMLGQNFFVENKVGAGGIVGQQAVAASAPDGYTIMLTSSGPMAINPGLYTKLPYDPIKDYAPLGGVANIPLVMVANLAFPVQNLQELVSLAKSKPGQINFASGGSGLTAHLAMEMFSQAAGIKMTHVPYKGSAPAITDLIGGRVEIMFDTPVAILSFIKDGRVKPIAVSGTTRIAALPNVPTVAESGVPGFSAFAWWAFVAPANTPAPVISKLSDAITKIVNMPEMHKYFADQGVEPMPMSPAVLSGFIKSEIDKWGKAAKIAGARAD